MRTNIPAQVRVAAGIKIVFVGLVAFVAAGFLLLGTFALTRSVMVAYPIGLAVGLVIMFAGISRITRSMRVESLGALQVLKQDPGRPCVYLRSFGEDGKPLDDVGRVEKLTGVMTCEVQVYRAIHHVGPYVAIGRPGEDVPPFGAARFYVNNDEWQGAVKTLLEQSAMVIIVAGVTEGVQWEVDQALAHEPLPAWFVFPPNSMDQVNALVEKPALSGRLKQSLDATKLAGNHVVVLKKSDGIVKVVYQESPSKWMWMSGGAAFVAIIGYLFSSLVLSAENGPQDGAITLATNIISTVAGLGVGAALGGVTWQALKLSSLNAMFSNALSLTGPREGNAEWPDEFWALGEEKVRG